LKVNILGYGVMGRQIAALLQLLGFSVDVWTRSPGADPKRASQLALKLARRTLALAEGPEPGEINFNVEIGSLEPACTIETLAENLQVKTAVLEQLPYDIRTIDFFTNTSSIQPHRVAPSAIGLHFFNPIFAIRLIELAGDPAAIKADGGLVIEALRKSGFTVVETHTNAGYIGNFILFQQISAALKLVDQFGYAPDQIDTVMNHLGASASLFDVIDLIGVDVTRAILLNLKDVDSSFHLSPSIEEAVQNNILGAKNKTSYRKFLLQRAQAGK
jgi:3-hydroxyacyl-CoA dehydrogenase